MFHFSSFHIISHLAVLNTRHAQMLAASKRVHKLRILPVRQIQPFLVLQLHVLRLRAQHGFLGVLSLAVPVNEQHVEQAHAPAHDDGDLGGDVAGRVFGAEGLRADDVADAVWVVC